MATRLAVAIKGGIGNQLFQLAFAEFLNLKGINIELDISHFAHDGYRRKCIVGLFSDFPLLDIATSPYSTLREGIDTCWLGQGNIFHLPLDPRSKLTLVDGYWQDRRFIHTKFTQTIKSRLHTLMSMETRALAERIRSRSSLAVHIRRHDYKHHGLVRSDFIITATKYLVERHSIAVPIFVYSDEPNYSRRLFESNNLQANVIQSGDDLVDFYLMSQSSHFLISNSTYSWWAAYLSSATTVFYPLPWSLLERTNKELFPEPWVGVVGALEPDPPPTDFINLIESAESSLNLRE